jgi:two-component system, OmpR family, sensor histidine kinase MprB
VTLRLKLVVAISSLAALATIAIGASTYRTTEDQLDAEVDRSLQQALASIETRVREGAPNPFVAVVPESSPSRPRTFERIILQIVSSDGEVVDTSAESPLPVDEVNQEVASDVRAPEVTRSVTIDGEAYRELTSPILPGYALQLVRSTDEVERVLDSIRTRTLISVIVVVAGGMLAGWLVAQRATRRLEHLTRTAEEVALTGRLDVPTPEAGPDEVGRLSGAIAGMLDALRRSREAQTQLVQDAGHELRTPLTSLRTNIALMRRVDELPPDTRQQVLDDLDTEARELSVLVDELVELATDQRRHEAVSEVDLGTLAEAVADRVRRRSGREIIVASNSPTIVEGRAGALDRAIGNLVDNACKFSDPPSVVEIDVRGATVAVLDRGMGIPDEDLPRVFDRFYRAVGARSRPGSGLGLAIVSAVADDHGGRVEAGPREGGGTRMALVLPPDA